MNDLKTEVKGILEEYTEEITEGLKRDIVEITKEATKKLKRTSPTRSGKYARNWRNKVEEGRLGSVGHVFNKKCYSLVHLLENGHVTKNGTGRTFAPTPPHPHVEKANEEAQKELIRRTEERIRG